ncbi:MAG: S-adenosylmethionine:tRNA ribosyltransferase-isomerase [Oligoflexales bacterium]
MITANDSIRHFENTKLLAITGSHPQVRHARIQDLGSFLQPGDVLVVNRSATMPSSFSGIHKRDNVAMEIRLASFQGEGLHDLSRWYAIAFGEGDWRTPTENRRLPPRLEVDDVIIVGRDLRIIVESVDTKFNRLVKIRFESSDLIKNLYEFGKPIQYSYLRRPLAIWDQQTIFAGPPISVEPPSASFALTWDQVFRLRERGVIICSILHGAGISSTGSEGLDAVLPLAEWYEVPQDTVNLIRSAKQMNQKIIALGTTVARALESAVSAGDLQAQSGFTTLKIGQHTRLSVVNGLISGLHAPGTSHLEMSKAFCSQEHIQRGYVEAERLGYRDHEFGDLSFLSCL